MRTKNIFRIALCALAVLLAAGCTKEFQEVTQLSLERCIQPINLGARTISSLGNVVNFSWDTTKDVEEYELIVFEYDTDKANGEGSQVASFIVPADQVPYQATLEEDLKCGFKVRGKSSKCEPSNWAYFDSNFRTYAVKDNLFLKAVSKTSSSLTLSWSKDVNDYTDVERIECTPVKGGKAIVYTLTDADKSAASATVPGLAPSTEYSVVLFFKSASRGALDAWTLPDASSVVTVSDAAALKEAMVNGGNVFVSISGSPYEVGSIKPVSGFRVLGETDAEGNRPVIWCDVKLGEDYTGGDFYAEGVEFNGQEGKYSRIFEHNGGTINVSSIKLVNCAITNYSAGLFYDNNSNPMTLGEFVMEGCEMHDISGGSGDCFDVRQSCTINNISLVNNTIYDGVRTLFRLDVGLTLGDMTFENNTVKNIANFDNSNCRGIFAVRSQVNRFSLKKNLFLHENDANPDAATLRSQLFQSNAATLMPTSLDAADNYVFVHGADFFKQCSAADAAVTELDEDPCFNSKGNYFNLSNQELAEKQIGAAKWWNAFVQEVEDLTQNALEGAHTWNLQDAKLFAGEVKSTRVRDELLLVASEQVPMNTDGAINFLSAAPTNSKGVPTDGYISFIVSKAGSVDLEIADSEGKGNGVKVALIDGKGFSIMGGVVASAAGSVVQKVVVSPVSGEGIVYIYPTGPVSILKLAWSKDTSAGDKVLPSPVPSVEPVTLTEGDETAVTITWEAVRNAASYVVVFNKKSYEPQTELSFTVPAEEIAALKAGLYSFSVTANPASGDIYYTKSEPGTASFAIQPKGGGGGEAVTVTKTWDFSLPDWQDAFARYGALNTDITNWDLTHDDLTIFSTAKSKYNTTFFQWGGKGSTSDRYMKFTAPEQGVLKVWASNTGSSEDLTRLVAVNVNNEEQTVPAGTPSSAEPTVAEFNVPAGEVYVYASGNALRFYKLEFTYTTSGEPAVEPVEYDWNFSDTDWIAAFQANFTAINNNEAKDFSLNGLDVVSGGSSLKYNVHPNGSYFIQMGGKGTASVRAFQFDAPSGGKVSVWATNTGDSDALDRTVAIALDGAELEAQPGGYAKKDGGHQLDFTIPSGGRVAIYGPVNGLCFYQIHFSNK
ncbi:MAG: DUF4957 domain-containing protein [Bacteroidales bacterium]|nr:DUF4957 domain-containing protein [Bacteroidales bacterium]